MIYFRTADADGFFLRLAQNSCSEQEETSVDIRATVLQMRKSRRFLVQTPAQYLFVYQALQRLLEVSIDSI